MTQATLLLAEKLHDQYGDHVTRFDYLAIPRGGLIVLGMLGYFLHLDRKNLNASRESDTLIVVDDICYSGTRMRQALADQVGSRNIIIAVLYSTPAVREKILEQERNVVACVSSTDLPDLTPHDPQNRSAEQWQSLWLQRLPGKRYWGGRSERVIFPWSEPDSPTWNPERQQLEEGWLGASPDACLKNWAGLGLPPRLATREFRIPDSAWYRFAGQGIQLLDSETGNMFHIEGTAAEMWRALAAYGNRNSVADLLLEIYETSAEDLHLDLECFIDQLLSQNLLERTAG